LERIRGDRLAGKCWQRVRIVSVPLSDWTRYGIGIARLSVTVGEDIRYLRRDTANRLGLQPYDAWLFDNQRLVHLHFDDNDDTFTGAELLTDNEVVQRHRSWRDLAWQHAQKIENFLDSLP